jgi:hypothetical protein
MATSTTKPPAKRRGKQSKVVEMEPLERPETAVEAAAEPAEPVPTRPEAPRVSNKPFPAPPRGKGKGGYCDEAEGMAYWRGLPAEYQNRLTVYINREWPVLNPLLGLSEAERQMVARRERKRPPKYIDKPAEPFAADARMEFLQRYGSGEFKVYINDSGVKGARKDGDPDLLSHNLCKFWVTYIDSDYPPVLDPSRPDKGLALLDLTHPKNQSYITDLRMRGILRPTVDTGGDDDMANAEVLGKLADKVDSLAGQVADGKIESLFTKLRGEIIAGRNTGGGSSDRMTDLLIAMILKDHDKPAPAPAADPIAIMQAQLTELRQELRDERAARQRYEDSLRTRAEQPPPDPFTFIERTVATFDKAKSIFGGASGDSAAGAAVKAASKMNGMLEFLSEVIPKVIEAPILTALANRISAGGMSPVAPGTNGVNAAPAAANADAIFVQTVITPALLSYMEAGSDGGDFAGWVYAGFPERLRRLQQPGPAAIIKLYQDSALWPRLAPREFQFRQFVAEFCAWKPDDAEEPEGDEVQAAAATATNGVHAPIIDLDAPIEGRPIA